MLRSVYLNICCSQLRSFWIPRKKTGSIFKYQISSVMVVVFGMICVRVVVRVSYSNLVGVWPEKGLGYGNDYG